jgi:FHS family L-fucose permease-like MFS transporter
MTTTSKKSNGPLLIIGVLFFVFGFVTWVNSVLIAFFKDAFNLNNFQSLLVTSAFFISYFVMAIPSSWVLSKTGFKNGMSFGLLTMAVGTLLFVPAANMANYPLFLLGLFIIGTGLALLQTASNPYVTILGPRESAATRISFMGICNKVAGILSQFIFGGLLLSGAAGTTQDLSIVISPYSIMTAVLIALALLVRFSSLPEVEAEEEDEANQVAEKSSVWAYPNLVLGLVAFFLYVGVEVMAGDTIINYGTSQGISMDVAKIFTTYTLYGMLAGYIVGILFIPKYLSQQKALNYSAILGLVFSVGTVALDGYMSVMCLALLGIANALMWPALWPLAIQGLGKFTKIGSALIIMMIAGGALVPLLYGKIADSMGDTQTAYAIMIPCYLFILYYATIGHKKSSW